MLLKEKHHDFYRYKNLDFKDFMFDIDDINYNNFFTDNDNI